MTDRLLDMFDRVPLVDPSELTVPAMPDKEQAAFIQRSFEKTVSYMKSLQRSDGYWWFTLEANESIGAEFIFLMHYLGAVDEEIQQGIAQRILEVQRQDGTWALYYDGPADLSTTVECYFALKMAGRSPRTESMVKARQYILSQGGAEKTRVFTKMHLAMFGIVPWSACPAMPVEFMLFPKWFPINIYSFSSWARATIVPLLLFMSLRKTIKLPEFAEIEELFVNPREARDFTFRTEKGFFSLENGFLWIDRALKLYEKMPFKRLRNAAIATCNQWIWEHIERTEDIYPALAYGAIAFFAQGYDLDSPEIKKPFEALKMFQQRYAATRLPALPEEIRDDGTTRPSQMRALGMDPRVEAAEDPDEGRIVLGNDAPVSSIAIHQQCCISPVWDTPWMMTALLEAGAAADDPALLKSGRWLLKKQILDVRGDWEITNPKGIPGGWSFEFENDYFPDVDDTVQVLTVLGKLAIPWQEKSQAFERGIGWILSMQNRDGGWGAFDKNQTREIVNRIPFSDHKACLDPSTPDITARVIDFFLLRRYPSSHPAIQRAIAYLRKTQEDFGPWFARWGINYLYGTWCVLEAAQRFEDEEKEARVERAVSWLKSVQLSDGGFSESPETYASRTFIPYSQSVPSQTAWALMALVAAGEAESPEATRAARFLLEAQNEKGSWDEEHYTGTGFPGHFYIRYHGYRYFFPLLALARYARAGGVIAS